MPLFLFIFIFYNIYTVQSSNHIHTIHSPRPLSISSSLVAQWERPQVGPYRKCCHVQTKAPGDDFYISRNLGISHIQIYLMYTILVKHTQKVFQPKYSSFMAFKFLLKICLYLHSFELFNCGHGTPYTSVHCCVRVTFWLMLVREK